MDKFKLAPKVDDEGRPISEPAQAADVTRARGNAADDDTSTDVDTPGRELTDEHRDFLADHAVDPDLVRDHVRSVVEQADLPDEKGTTWSSFRPTTLHRWKMGEREAWQVRIPLEKRTEGGPKYLFPHGSEPPLNQFRDDGAGPILLVEGTLQHLAAACHAPDKFAVYGMFGCWGYSKVDPSFMADRLVYVIFDADLKSNRDVWNAAVELKRTAKTVKASGVKFVHVPGGGSTGLDDFLAKITDPAARREALLTLIDDAATDLPRAPAKKKQKTNGPASLYFDENGQLQPLAIAKVVHATLPLAISAERRIAVYRNGVYRTDELALVSALAELMGDDWKHGYFATIEDVMLGMLDVAGRHLPDHIDLPWMNTLDGMVDLATGEPHDWDPSLLSTVQFPIHYDPSATCPTFDRWAKEIVGDQLQDLLETVAVMLDPTKIPIRAPLLYGPTRSGKSTFLRLLVAIVGRENSSAVSLHELVKDNFARAGVYGKTLNTSADLSAKHLDDVTWFKLMTGEDRMRGNRKYGRDFFFTNQALFAFSANELPTVGESSDAYIERIKPFKFGHSFAGRVDDSIEKAMMLELPGILNLLVAAYRNRKERGSDLVTNPTIQREFEEASDRVRLWFAEEMRVVTEYKGQPVMPGMVLPADLCTVPTVVATMFNRHAAANFGPGMTRKKVLQRLVNTPGVVEVRQAGAKTRAFNVVRNGGAVAEVAGNGGVGDNFPVSEKGSAIFEMEKLSPPPLNAATSATAVEFGKGNPWA